MLPTRLFFVDVSTECFSRHHGKSGLMTTEVFSGNKATSFQFQVGIKQRTSSCHFMKPLKVFAFLLVYRGHNVAHRLWVIADGLTAIVGG